MKQFGAQAFGITALAATLVAGPALAQGGQMDHSKMGDMKHEMKDAGLSSLPSVDGEVRRVDKAAGKITLRHGEIKQLDMPPMTMVFEVKDKAMLDTVKPGDKVTFKVINEQGKMIVTELKPAS